MLNEIGLGETKGNVETWNDRQRYNGNDNEGQPLQGKARQ